MQQAQANNFKNNENTTCTTGDAKKHYNFYLWRARAQIPRSAQQGNY